MLNYLYLIPVSDGYLSEQFVKHLTGDFELSCVIHVHAKNTGTYQHFQLRNIGTYLKYHWYLFKIRSCGDSHDQKHDQKLNTYENFSLCLLNKILL